MIELRRKEILELNKRVRENEKAIDDLQQYSRRNCLLFWGIPETPDEDVYKVIIDVSKKSLRVNLTMADIDRAHRLGVKKRRLASEIVQEGARSIIVKFVSYQTRNDIWKAKRNLKGTKILVTESLTPARQALLKEVKERLDPRQVWTADGKIMAKVGNRKLVIVHKEDLNMLET